MLINAASPSLARPAVVGRVTIASTAASKMRPEEREPKTTKTTTTLPARRAAASRARARWPKSGCSARRSHSVCPTRDARASGAGCRHASMLKRSSVQAVGRAHLGCRFRPWRANFPVASANGYGIGACCRRSPAFVMAHVSVYLLGARARNWDENP
ncbi:hypothetical protein VTO73DRAFT_7681 [Trametes versicolor]